MADQRPVVANVLEFIEKASAMRGRMMAERFASEMRNNIVDVGLESPIEDLFWVAFRLMCEANYTPVNPEPMFNSAGVEVRGGGLFIRPQAKVGPYRVDFIIDGMATFEEIQPIVVELDGHAFHDKDKQQRSYEKARDRYLVRHGHRVIHFTGSDVVADPFKCVHEVLDLAGAYVGFSDETASYDPRDPLGIA